MSLITFSRITLIVQNATRCVITLSHKYMCLLFRRTNFSVGYSSVAFKQASTCQIFEKSLLTYEEFCKVPLMEMHKWHKLKFWWLFTFTAFKIWWGRTFFLGGIALPFLLNFSYKWMKKLALIGSELLIALQMQGVWILLDKLFRTSFLALNTNNYPKCHTPMTYSFREKCKQKTMTSHLVYEK